MTLWGPTHLMLIGGASLSLLGAWALHAEGDEERRAAGRPLPSWTRFREIVLAGAFLVALSTFQAEFDFGVPQFALGLQPMLIMLAAGIGLVTARIRFGPGGAVAALAVYIAIRGILTLLVGPLFGEITPHFPLYVVEALVVEGVALAYLRGEPAAERPITFGALAGLGDRHGRPGRRVGLVPRLGRQPLAGLPLPRGRDHRPDRRGRRRRDRRLHRPLR